MTAKRFSVVQVFVGLFWLFCVLEAVDFIRRQP